MGAHPRALLLALLVCTQPARGHAQAEEDEAAEQEREADAEQEEEADAEEVAVEGAADVVDPEAQETAMARALFRDGVEHARAGSFHRAADFFRRAQSMRPTPAVAYNLASALVQVGRLMEGSEVLHWVLRHPGTSSEMVAAAEVTIAQIRPRLARVRLVLTGGLDEIELRIDGRAIGLEVLGVMVPLDPGHHVIEAYRGDERVAETEVELAEGSRQEVELVVPGGPEVDLRALAAIESPRREDDLSWLLWSGIGVGAAIVLGLAIGIGVAAQPEPPLAIPGTTNPPVLEWR